MWERPVISGRKSPTGKLEKYCIVNPAPVHKFNRMVKRKKLAY